MEMKIITYVDGEKLQEERHNGLYEQGVGYEKITYNDENKKKIKIFIDKIKESVSIEKDNSKMAIEYSRKSNDYSTPYGLMKLDTQLVKLDKKTRRSLVMYDVIYNIYFGENDKQQNELKILIKL